MIDVFVLRDFSLGEIGMVLEALSTRKGVFVPGLGDTNHGEIFREIESNIARADRVLAVVGKPNANVAFEIGYAMGLGKPIALITFESGPPEWLRLPPLNGFYVHPVKTLEEIEEILETGRWFEMPEIGTGGRETLFICPSEGNGGAVRDRFLEPYPDWKVLPAEGWSLLDLPRYLSRFEKTLWAITAPLDMEKERDGYQNCMGAVVAGLAHATRRPFFVVRDAAMRPIADVEHMQRVFESLDKLRDIIEEIFGPRQEGQDPVPAYAQYLRSVHSSLVPFFPEAASAVLDQVYVELSLGVGRTSESGGARDDLPRTTTLHELMMLPADADRGTTGRWVVLGEPGAGKSTLARHLVWDLAGRQDGPVPVYVSLARYAQTGSHPFKLAEEDVRSSLGDRQADGLEVRLRELAREPGCVWLFLDGLDEVSPDYLDRMPDRLRALAGDLEGAVIVVFSRAIGYTPLGVPFVEAEIHQLEQSKRPELLRKWLPQKDADEIWLRLKSQPGLMSLTSNPLMLTLVASLAIQEDSLPSNRIELYGRAINLLLTRGFSAGGSPVRDPEGARFVLQRLSLELQESTTPTWTRAKLDHFLRQVCIDDKHVDFCLTRSWGTGKEFFDDVSRNSGVLGSHDGEREPWRFLHRQFREFLAAEALYDQDEGLARCRDLDRLSLPRWAETMALLCGLSDHPLEMLRSIRDVDADLALRALPEIDGLAPVRMLQFLLTIDGWDIDHLRRVVSTWKARGEASPEEIESLIWSIVDDRRTIEQLAYVHVLLCELGRPPARQEFFQQCGRWPSRAAGVDWVKIAGGTYAMGVPRGRVKALDCERPVHQVTLRAFELSAATVTNAVYSTFDPEHEPRTWVGVSDHELGEHPVVEVSWWEAYLFSEWVGGRLPSESEWEYACRAGTSTMWSTGEVITTELANYDGALQSAGGQSGKALKQTVPVRSYGPNPWGLYEMHGNVGEWCQDEWHPNYHGAPVDGSAWLAGSIHRVVRGGSWDDYAAACKSGGRNKRQPADRSPRVGFRVARSLDDSGANA